MTAPACCRECGAEIVRTASSWRCSRSLAHPSGAILPEVPFGALFGPPGDPWARLRDQRSGHNRGTDLRSLGKAT